MSFKYNRVDLALVSTGPTEIIDIGEEGGAPMTHLVLEKTGGGAVSIEGCETEGGTYETVATITVPTDGFYRERIPLALPKYIRLAATGATLSIRG